MKTKQRINDVDKLIYLNIVQKWNIQMITYS